MGENGTVDKGDPGQKRSEELEEDHERVEGLAKVLRNWRVQPAAPFGCHVWFDPEIEKIIIMGLTSTEKRDSIEKYGSVSALVEGEGGLFNAKKNQ